MKIILPALTLAFAAPAAAQMVAPPPEAPAASSADEDDAANPNRMICKREKSTGSRLRSERICLTAAQWEQRHRDERQATERAQNRDTKY